MTSSAEAYFSHMPGARAEDAPLQNATRYLCAAAYLDQSFARKVIREFVEEGHRAVVPSFGFDVAAVVGHCLRARRMRIARDLTLLGSLLLCLIIDALAVGAVVFLWLPLAVVPFIPWRRLSWFRRIVVGAVLAWFSQFPFVLLLGASAALQALDGQSEDYFTEGSDSGEVLAARFLLVGAVFFAVLVLAPLGYRFFVYRTLRALGPGSRVSSPQAVSARVQQTLDRVATAQRGNVTIYSRENPFLGSGDVTAPWARAWSIVVELDRRAGAPAAALSKEPGPETVDPVRLHRHVSRRLIAMRDGPAPQERIGGLLVDWHVVAQGECRQGFRPIDPGGERPEFQGHPLIDARYSVPYSRAGDAAIEAIVRHPQANIRCYQRVTVGTQGQAIRDGFGQPIAPAEDQDIMLSAFLYLAVEGRMLYAQFVANVMPPIRQEFLVVDVLPTYGTEMLVLRTLREGALRALGEGFLGPFRLARTCAQMVREAIRAGGRVPSSFLTYDYGARISVREEAAEAGFRTFMQALDADKYTSLIERRINEAVLDFLQQCEIDVTAYREQAAVVLNSPFIMTGGSIAGSQIAVGGAGAHIAQEQSRPNP